MMAVNVPAGIGPGDAFTLQTPDGNMLQVTCPPDAMEGQVIHFKVQPQTMPAARGVHPATNAWRAATNARRAQQMREFVFAHVHDGSRPDVQDMTATLPEPVRTTGSLKQDKMKSLYHTGSPHATRTFMAPNCDGIMSESDFDQATIVAGVPPTDPFVGILNDATELALDIDVEGRVAEVIANMKSNCYGYICVALSPCCLIGQMTLFCSWIDRGLLGSCGGENETTRSVRQVAQAHRLSLGVDCIVYERRDHYNTVIKNFLTSDQYGHRYPACVMKEAHVPAMRLSIPLSRAEVVVIPRAEIILVRPRPHAPFAQPAHPMRGPRCDHTWPPLPTLLGLPSQPHSLASHPRLTAWPPIPASRLGLRSPPHGMPPVCHACPQAPPKLDEYGECFDECSLGGKRKGSLVAIRVGDGRTGAGLKLVVACVECGPNSNVDAWVAAVKRAQSSAPPESPQVVRAFSSWLVTRLGQTGRMTGAPVNASIRRKKGDEAVPFVKTIGPFSPLSPLGITVDKSRRIYSPLAAAPFASSFNAGDQMLSLTDLKGTKKLAVPDNSAALRSALSTAGGYMEVLSTMPYFEPNHLVTLTLPSGLLADSLGLELSAKTPPKITAPTEQATALGLGTGDAVVQAVVNGALLDAHALTAHEFIAAASVATGPITLTMLQSWQVASAKHMHTWGPLRNVL